MGRFGIKEVCDVSFYSLSTNLPVLYLDTLKMSDVENKATTTFAQGGRGNPRILSWDFDRQITFKCQDALLSLQSLAVLAGNSSSTGVQNIFYREVLTVATSSVGGDNKVTLTNVPVNSTSVSLWTSLDGGKSQSAQITGISLNGSEVDFPNTTPNAAVGSQVIAFYQYSSSASAQQLIFTSDAFPGYYKIVGDTLYRDEQTGNDEALQIVLPKAKLDPTFTLTLRPDGNPTVLDFTLEVFKDTSTDEMLLWTQH